MLGVMLLATPVFAIEMPHIRAAVQSKLQPSIAGTVSSIDGTTIGLDARNGKAYRVDASSSNILKLPNTEIRVSNIVVGDSILVHGRISNSSIKAVRIMVGVSAGDAERPKPTMRPNDEQRGRGDEDRPGGIRLEKRFGGVIVTISAPNFTLGKPGDEDDARSAQVITASSTIFTSGGATSTFNSLTVGSRVVVFGAYETSTNTITAEHVEIGTSTPARPIRTEVRGEVRKEMSDEIRTLVTSRLRDEFGTSTPSRAFVTDIVDSIWHGLSRFFSR